MTTLTPPMQIDKVKDHLANERTFLAWIRTSISIIVFGFVVAKFGITLYEFLHLQNQTTAKESNFSLSIGVGFMAMGIVLALLSLIRYRITMQRIETAQFKPANAMAVLLGIITALFGAILVVYLIMTAHAF